MKQENYFSGILGGLLGGIIASVPWILMYLFGNMMFSALAIIIAMGALQGYKLCKGKMDSKLPMIITILSLISITIATLLIIPLALLAKNGYEASFGNLEWLYQNNEFTGALMKDYFISVVFTLLGISGVTSQLKKGENPKLNLKVEETEEGISTIKEAFQKHNAMRKADAVEKDVILNEIQDLTIQKVIRKSKKRYYFDEKCEKSILRRFLLIYWNIIKWILFFLLVIIIPILFL